jgi:glycerophosphoryl diester phosphodiesterase
MQIRRIDEPVLVIGHRGATGYAPENTIPSFQKGLDLGANWVETDVRKTQDGAFVLIHDSTVDRTTNGQGDVSNLTLTQIQELDAGGWYLEEYSGAKVPTLDDMLAWASGGGQIGICLDLSPRLSLADIKAISRLVTTYSMASRTLVLSGKTDQLVQMKGCDDRITTGWIYREDPEACLEIAIEMGIDFLHPNRHIVTEDLIRAAHARGLPVAASVNSEETWMRARLEWGLDVFNCDHPDLPRKF